ncbi:hypothetical protein [Pedobacter sp. SYSU D00535]|uniref:hypothetical protein n=1 Tax=Pedobacter sp. SYSU D00535 TaxID=2810308 RepID=UPI001A958372|nr:hypothetical protein [Pedobacter sp. SYSU D00535]
MNKYKNPLYCDGCGEIILDPKEAIVEYFDRGEDLFDFKIVHNFSSSPRQLIKGGCLINSSHSNTLDLRDFVGQQREKTISELEGAQADEIDKLLARIDEAGIKSKSC